MTSPYRALIWEQSRTAGVLAGWYALNAGIVLLVVRYTATFDFYRLDNAAFMAHGFAESFNSVTKYRIQGHRFSLISTAVASLQGSRGRINFTTDELKTLYAKLKEIETLGLEPARRALIVKWITTLEKYRQIYKSNIVSKYDIDEVQIHKLPGFPEFILISTGISVYERVFLANIYREYAEAVSNGPVKAAKIVVELAKKDDPEILRIPITELRRDFIPHSYTDHDSIYNDWDLTDMIESLASLRCAITGIAVERYRLENGQRPHALAELVPQHIEEVPTDPFSGEALRYKQTENGYIVYSVGPDREDDGGREPEEGTSLLKDGDILFEVIRTLP